MIRIVVIDVGNRHTIVESLAQNTEIELVGAIVSVAEEQNKNEVQSFYESMHCPIIDFSDLGSLKLFKLPQLLNAYPPIYSTLSGVSHTHNVES